MTAPTRGQRKANATNAKDAAAWQQHEHISQEAQAAADRLLNAVGTAELAKHAVDVVAEGSMAGSTPHHDLATRVGFASYLDLASASKSVAGIHHSQEGWHITPLQSGRWIVWNDSELREQQFDNRTAAERWLSSPA